MNEPVHVVCPRCNTTNRVQRERLDGGARCGSCGEALLPAQPFELNAEGFDRHVASNDLPLVIDFWAPWCGPCRTMAPAFAEAAARLGPKVRLAKLNAESEPDVAGRLGIRGIPTLIAYRNGREIARQSGAMNLPGLLGWIQANV